MMFIVNRIEPKIGQNGRNRPKNADPCESKALNLQPNIYAPKPVGLAPTPETPAEMIADTGYHSREGLKALEDSAWKSRILETEQKAFARWQGDDAARRYNNRARLKRPARLSS